MRSSMFLALASSGATFSAPNRKSRLRMRPPRGSLGISAGGSIRSFLPGGSCGPAGGRCCAETVPATRTAASARTIAGKWRFMRLNLRPDGRGEKAVYASRARDAAAPEVPIRRQNSWNESGKTGSALARLEAALGLVDDVDPALAAD